MSEWKPFPWQENALLRDEFEILAGGARGPGKTDCGQVWLLGEKNPCGNLYIDHPRYRALVLRKNAEDLADWLDRATYMYAGVGGVVSGKPATVKFPSGAIFRTGHLKDRKSYEKYLGHEYQRELVEELTQIPQEMYYLQIMGSCRSTVDGLKPQIFNTTNPGGVGHVWVKERFVDVAPPGTPYTYRMKVKDKELTLTRIFIPATLDDNTVLMEKDPQYVAVLEVLKEKDPDLYKAWRWGDWDVFAGQYFKTFRKDLHIINPFIPDGNGLIVGGLDWGRTDPFSFHLAEIKKITFNGVTFHRVRTFLEVYGTDKDPKDWAEEIKKKLKFYGIKLKDIAWVQADTQIYNKPNDSQSKSIYNLFKDADDDFQCLRPADKDRIQGWMIMLNWMSIAPDGLPYYQITSNCENLIREIPVAIHDEHNVEDIDDLCSDHALDDQRYMLRKIKWIDAKVGGITHKQDVKQLPTLVVTPSGKIETIDINKFR